MMTRGSDPAERRSPPGADHLAVKEAEGRSKQVAGHHAVIAVEEEGDPKDPVVEATLDQVLETRTRGLGGLPSDLSTLKDADPDDEQDYDCDIDIYMHVHQDCVSGGPSVRTRKAATLSRVRAAILPYKAAVYYYF